ncbi:eukaryotic translation initiation factor 3C [Striga asiatica]|uniref:Eukaryotic translation initiation factor 3C n=1 Tax=Striga asiatica TaxID=4170 RepID=A0A5A7P4W1_STRAF|nr:eukaryotic translation initiation factor 3C [Striga asiatica]
MTNWVFQERWWNVDKIVKCARNNWAELNVKFDDVKEQRSGECRSDRAVKDETDLVLETSRDFSGSSVEANISAVLWVLRKATEHHLRNITCILHCKKAIDILNKWKKHVESDGDDALDFLSLCQLFSSCSFYFVDLVCKLGFAGINNEKERTKWKQQLTMALGPDNVLSVGEIL